MSRTGCVALVGLPYVGAALPPLGLPYAYQIATNSESDTVHDLCYAIFACATPPCIERFFLLSFHNVPLLDNHSRMPATGIPTCEPFERLLP